MLSHFAGVISAQFITRLLIISYFVAMSLGLIQGIDVSRMAALFLPEIAALYVMRLIILSLCGMVLFNVFRRPAALVLALIIFWTSYLTLYAGGEISAFWRDLALIGGLLLTANVTAYADRGLSEDWDGDYEDGTADASELTGGPRNEPEFREDFDVARAG